MKYTITGACKSVVGNVRKNNEDNYYFNFKTMKEDNEGTNKTKTMQFENVDNVVCAVFDGMGGEVKGERASYLGSSILKKHIQKNTNRKFIWKEYIEEANDKICEEMTENLRMGTTMAAIQLLKEKISICNLGDSRIYGIKNRKLEQISVDHTDENLNKKLEITNRKPRLTQHLGIKKEELKLVATERYFEYEDFDKILLCTDGLTDMLSNNEIEEILSQKIDVKEIVDELVNKALEKGGIDNITVIVFELRKKKKINYKVVLPILIGAVLIFSIIISNIKGSGFEIVVDNYSEGIVVGESYDFKYKGNVTISFSNDNLEFKDNKITAQKEGITIITIKNKKGETLYNKTVKVFPK